MEDDIRHFVLNRQAAVISELGFLAINLNPRLQGSKLFVKPPPRGGLVGFPNLNWHGDSNFQKHSIV